MKTGKSLVEMAQELTNLKENARDFSAPISKVTMEVTLAEPPAKTTAPAPLIAAAAETIDSAKLMDEIIANTERARKDREAFQAAKAAEKDERPARHAVVSLETNGGTAPRVFFPTNWAHGQIAAFCDIPRGYYDRLGLQNPDLLAMNVNHGLTMAGGNRMLRTVGGTLRALVSTKYRRLDSYDLLEAVLPTIMKSEMKVVSSELTDMRLYIKALSDKITGEVKVGDTVQFGLVVSSSDVGAGAVRVEPLIYRLACSNGMIMQSAIKTRHVGRNQAEDDVYELLTDKTKELTDAAFWAQVRDVVVASMRPEVFNRQLETLRAAANDQIRNFDLPEVVELTSRAVGITGEGTKQGILSYLANGADGAGLTRWGLANAITAAAQDEAISYDESVELERKGAAVIDLPRKEWQKIAEAAA